MAGMVPSQATTACGSLVATTPQPKTLHVPGAWGLSMYNMYRVPFVGPCKLSEVDGNLVFTWRFGAQILTDRIPTYPKLSAFFLTVLMCENQLAEGHLLPEGA